jgi:hypothetical protein
MRNPELFRIENVHIRRVLARVLDIVLPLLLAPCMMIILVGVFAIWMALVGAVIPFSSEGRHGLAIWYMVGLVVAGRVLDWGGAAASSAGALLMHLRVVDSQQKRLSSEVTQKLWVLRWLWSATVVGYCCVLVWAFDFVDDGDIQRVRDRMTAVAGAGGLVVLAVGVYCFQKHRGIRRDLGWQLMEE